jgi:hydroxyethylthiazole kinase-like uncharacterized protein yjeF
MWNDRLFMTRDQMREYDRLAIEDVGVPGVVLMENAGRGAAAYALALLGDRRRVAVLAGPGNNGGDGFVIARHLLNAGHDVTTYLAVAPSKIKGDAKTNYDILRSMNPRLVQATDKVALEGLPSRLRHDGFVIDALLGTGVSREVEGLFGDLIELVNQARLTVLAVDIPSGLDADTGTPWGKAIHATATATFGHLKRGLVLYPGAELAGQVQVIPIGAPYQVSDRAGFDGEVLAEARVRRLIPSRPRAGHKGTFGHLLLLAGSLGKAGAAALAGQAALRTGPGLVTLATTGVAQPVLQAGSAELMVEAVIDSAEGPFDAAAEARIGTLLRGKQALAIGPGLTTEAGAAALVRYTLGIASVPAVVDADGLNIMAAEPERFAEIEAPLVLTPHPGEMARLTGRTVAEVQTDRIGMARELAAARDAVVALKGAHTVIAAPDGRVFVNPTGNSGMATAGTGDVLTGLVGGLLAQGVDPLDATLIGVYVHGLAGDRAAERVGRVSLVASDLIGELPRIFNGWGV